MNQLYRVVTNFCLVFVFDVKTNLIKGINYLTFLSGARPSASRCYSLVEELALGPFLTVDGHISAVPARSHWR